MTRAQSAFAIGSFALLLFALIKIRNLEHKLAASGALAEGGAVGHLGRRGRRHVRRQAPSEAAEKVRARDQPRVWR